MGSEKETPARFSLIVLGTLQKLSRRAKKGPSVAADDPQKVRRFQTSNDSTISVYDSNRRTIPL